MDLIALLSSIPAIGPYLPYVLVVFGIASIVMTVLPPPKSAASLYGYIYTAINLAAQNYGQAKNATTPPPAPPGGPAKAAAWLLFLFPGAAIAMRFMAVLTLSVMVALLAACSPAQMAAFSAAAAKAQAGVVKFCLTDQPVVGTVATMTAGGVAIADPALAPVGAVTGLVVQDVNGVCNGLTAVPPPAAGTKVVVPSATP